MKKNSYRSLQYLGSTARLAESVERLWWELTSLHSPLYSLTGSLRKSRKQ